MNLNYCSNFYWGLGMIKRRSLLILIVSSSLLWAQSESEHNIGVQIERQQRLQALSEEQVVDLKKSVDRLNH